MSDSTFLLLQHIDCEPGAAYEDVLADRGMRVHRVRLDRGEAPPDWRRFAGIVVMGGPMGAYEDERYPWLLEEKRLLGDAARAGAPCWGVCLGAQLLAAALGAAVGRAPEPEVGVLHVATTGAAARDPVFRAAPSEFPALHWHGDTYALPAGATLLACSRACPQQALAFRRAYGIQFHLEVPPDLAARWAEVPAYADALNAALGPGGADRLLDEVAAHADEMTALARALFARWLDAVVGHVH